MCEAGVFARGVHRFGILTSPHVLALYLPALLVIKRTAFSGLDCWREKCSGALVNVRLSGWHDCEWFSSTAGNHNLVRHSHCSSLPGFSSTRRSLVLFRRAGAVDTIM